MRAAKFAVLLLLLVVVLSADGWAQRRCYQIPFDTTGSNFISLNEARGKPGEIIELELSLDNGVNVTAFQFLIEMDTTFFKPLIEYVDTFYTIDSIFDTVTVDPVLVDTTVDTVRITRQEHYQFTTSDRFIKEFNLVTQDSVNKIFTDATSERDAPSVVPTRLRMQVTGTPRDPLSFEAGIAEGSGTVVRIPFQIPATAEHFDFSNVYFYFVEIFDESVVPPIYLGCKHNNITDPLGTSIRPLYDTTTYSGRLIVDTTDFPVVNSFTANPASITEGGSTKLKWDCSNTIEVTVSGVSGTFNAVDSVTVSPSVSTTYTLTASNGAGSEVNADVFVSVTPIGDNTVPVVEAIVPSSYTISQGENVSFSVSASDADGDALTLFASNLPANATFGIGGEVSGVGSVSGNFSFTPNTSQEGTYTIEFRARDALNATSTARTVSITVEGIEFDILFSKSSAGGSPVGGLEGKTGILFPIDLVTSQTVYGVQFDFFYDDQYFKVDSILTTPRTQDYVIYDNIGQTPGEVRILTFGMNNEEITTDSTNSTTILYVAMSIDSTATWGDYPIYLENGWESNNPDPSFPSLPLFTDSAIIQVDRLGDVNLDKRVDVADAVSIVGSILGNYVFVERQTDVADVVTDALVDVFDLVGVVNMIYGLPVEPAPTAPTGSEVLATVALDYGDLFSGSEDVLTVRSELPETIAGVQMDITYDPNSVVLGKPTAAPDADGLTLAYKNNGAGKLRILLNFTNPFNEQQVIRSGAADLVEIPILAQGDVEYGNKAQLNLADIKLSTPTARAVGVEGYGPALPTTFTLYQNYPNPFNPITTIDFALEGEVQHVSLEVFNVLGQQVRNLVDREMTPGHYSVEWDATNEGGRKVATGVYLYRLQVGNESDTKKMLLLK